MGLTVTIAGSLKTASDAADTQGMNMIQAQADGTKNTTTSFSTSVSGSLNSSNTIVSGVRLVKKIDQTAQGAVYSNPNMPSTYFAVNNGPGVACVRASTDDSSPILHTRRCDFTLQADGTYRNGAGLYLCGVMLDDTGNLPPGGLTMQNMKVLKIPRVSSKAIKTTEAAVTMKLSATAAPNTPAGTALFQANIYDSLGMSHNVSFNLTKVATNTWRVSSASFANGGTLTSPTFSAAKPPVGAATTLDIVFNTDGSIKEIQSTDSTPTTTLLATAEIPVTLDFSGNGAAAGQVVKLKFGSFGIIGGMTQNGTSETSVVYSVVCDGAAPSEALGDEIGKDGILYTRFAGGSSKPTKRAQIALAVYGNPNELSNANGTAVVGRPEAGDVVLQIPGTGSGGGIEPGHLEKSTTDTTQSYLEMLSLLNHQAVLMAALRHGIEADRNLSSI